MSRRSKRLAVPALKVPPAEQVLMEAADEVIGPHVLCTTLGRGQFARARAAASDAARVTCHLLDLYLTEQAREWCAAEGEGPQPRFDCAADFPPESFDGIALPIDPRGETELTLERLQAAHVSLRDGGRLVAASGDPRDQWLYAELRKLFAKVTRRPQKRGVLYLATKAEPLRKIKSHECEIVLRDGEHLIRAFSRPGVFNHRALDAGARALIATMRVEPGFRVLDMGCGSGVVGLAAALRAPGVSVLAVDSNARAIACARRGAELNGLETVDTVLSADGNVGEQGTCDLALGNPPYFSDYRIAEIFLQAARRALKPLGRATLVTKTPGWFEEHMPDYFDDVVTEQYKSYVLVHGVAGGTP